MTTKELSIALKQTCLNADIANKAINKIHDIEATSGDKKTVNVKMSQSDFKEFRRFKLFCEFIKNEL